MPGGRPGAKPTELPTCLVSEQRTDEGAIGGMAPPFGAFLPGKAGGTTIRRHAHRYRDPGPVRVAA
jgi:hypothetical protein